MNLTVPYVCYQHQTTLAPAAITFNNYYKNPKFLVALSFHDFIYYINFSALNFRVFICWTK